MAQARAPRVITGDKLKGTHPISRRVLTSMVVRSYAPEELQRSLEAVGFNLQTTVATAMVVAGNRDNEITGSFFCLSGIQLCY